MGGFLVHTLGREEVEDAAAGYVVLRAGVNRSSKWTSWTWGSDMITTCAILLVGMAAGAIGKLLRRRRDRAARLGRTWAAGNAD